MSQWGSSDSGILRKNRADENLDQLLVFGYSCKIFRDDEKAIYIDQGKHLIPWMGDEKLKIDRYDGRGTLSDLRQFEASREGYDALRWLGLSESEKKLEELCDSERYYSLEINEEEEEMYKEEAAKRQKTNAFAFDYNISQPTDPGENEGVPTVPEKEEEDEPYKPSPVLDVPVDINMPKTVKEYARIEKTALFVCRQGPQMEILIKAKQADNPQFSFLTVQDPLYKFYRHVLSAFKNGRYHPQCQKRADDPQAASAEDEHDAHYLHPSLVSASAKPVTPPLPQNPPVPYRPSADCSYSQLVNRIQGVGQGSNGQQEVQSVAVSQQQGVAIAPNQMQIISQMNLEQQYHQYYYVQQFYEYWRHSVINSEQGAMYSGLPLNFSQLDPNMQTYIHRLAWDHFVQHHQQKQMQEAQQAQASANSNSYAQIVSNLNKEAVNPYTANVPQLPPVESVNEETKPALAKEKINDERTVTLVKYEEDEVKKPLLSLAAAYGSESESDSDISDSEEADSADSKKPVSKDQVEVYRAPSGELQTVIDKMAEYVSKNGEQFEEIIRQKADPRFAFLNTGHEFNKYYRSKLRDLQGEPAQKENRRKVEHKRSKPKAKKVIAPVSFSIKTKDEPTKEIKSALPVEDSSDEEGYLDNVPKSPPVTSANNNNPAQNIPSNPKYIYKIGQPMLSSLPQPKTAQLPVSTDDTANNSSALVNETRMSPSKEAAALDSSNTPDSGQPESLQKDKLPRRRSKSGSFSPATSRRSRTPKKRSRSPADSCLPLKRTKSRSKTPPKMSPIRAADSPPLKLGGTPPIIESKIRSRKKKSPVIDMFDVGDDNSSKTKSVKTSNGVLEQDDPILEMMELERDGKTAEEIASDAKEKARQLERKRKAAMFLKLKSVETKSIISDKKPPVSNEKLPVVDKNSSTSEKKTPFPDQKPPVLDKKSPVSDRKPPVSDKKPPVSDKKSPVTDKTEKPLPGKSGKLSPVKTEKSSKISPSSSNSSRRNSEDSVLSVRSRSTTREKTKLKEITLPRDKSRSNPKDSSRLVRRSRSREKRKDSKKHKKDKDKDRSRSKDRDDEERKKRKEKKKKDHKRKHSKSKRKSKKHKRSRGPSKSRSRSKSIDSRSRSKTRSRSASVKSHISIDSS